MPYVSNAQPVTPPVLPPRDSIAAQPPLASSFSEAMNVATTHSPPQQPPRPASVGSEKNAPASGLMAPEKFTETILSIFDAMDPPPNGMTRESLALLAAKTSFPFLASSPISTIISNAKGLSVPLVHQLQEAFCAKTLNPFRLKFLDPEQTALFLRALGRDRPSGYFAENRTHHFNEYARMLVSQMASLITAGDHGRRLQAYTPASTWEALSHATRPFRKACEPDIFILDAAARGIFDRNENGGSLLRILLPPSGAPSIDEAAQLIDLIDRLPKDDALRNVLEPAVKASIKIIIDRSESRQDARIFELLDMVTMKSKTSIFSLSIRDLLLESCQTRSGYSGYADIASRSSIAR